MIGNERIEEGLRYAKTKAKLAEFSVPEKQRPSFKYDSDDLCFNAMHALARVANAYAHDKTPKEGEVAELRRAALFYDAASRSDDHKWCSDGFWLLAMATYFLLGNFGSAVVVSRYIDDRSWYGPMGEKFYSLVTYLLANGRQSVDIEAPQLTGYLQGADVSPEAVIAEARRNYINNDNAENHLFGNICFAATEVALEFASRRLLPTWSKLDVHKWVPYLSRDNTCRLLWQSQKYMAEHGAFAGNSLFVQLPTGSGKTHGIQLISRARILANQCNKAVVIAPLRALCSEITSDLTRDLFDIADVKQSTDAYEMDAWLSEKTAKPQVLVFTPEKFEYVERHGGNLISSTDLFILDEVQLIDDPHRGPAYELLMAEMKLRHPDAQLIMLSAVVSNPEEISAWAIGNSSSCVSSEGIPRSEKSLGIACASDEGKIRMLFQYIESDQRCQFDIPLPISRQLLRKYNKDRRDRYFPDLSGKKGRPNIAHELSLCISEILVTHGPIAIYIPQAISIPTFFSRLRELDERGCHLPNLTSSCNSAEGKRIAKLVKMHYGKRNPFQDGIFYGILPHYGNLQGCLRQVVEDEVEREEFKCVACTSTLAQGVNLPIKYLIITGNNQDGRVTKTRDFQNLVGRTARPGKFSEGSILIADKAALNDRSKRRVYGRLLDKNNSEACRSAISNLRADVTDRYGNVRIAGSKIMDCILESLEKQEAEGDENRSVAAALESCFSNMGLDVTKAETRREIDSRVNAVAAIETYVAAMIEISTDEVDAVRLCTGTFAFAAADDVEKEHILKLFGAVYDAMKNAAARLPASVYAKTQMGIAKTESLERWLAGEDGVALINASSDTERIALVCKAYQECGYTSGSVIDGTMLAELTDMWIDGKNLGEILGARSWGKSLKMYQLERFTSHDLRYSLANFISSIVDVLEGVSGNGVPERQVESLMLLQEEVKYGVNSPLGCAICGEIFEDRMVARDLVGILGHPEMKLHSDLKGLFAIHDEEVIQYLNELPAYFKRRYSAWKER